MMALWICKLPLPGELVSRRDTREQGGRKKRDKENYVKAGFGFTLMGFHFQTGHTFRESR